MMKRTALSFLLGTAAAASPALAETGDDQWFVRAGVTRLELADKIDLSVAGTSIPGTALHTKAHYTPTVQAGRFITKHLTVSATVGVPPRIAINGAGTLQPFGKLVETRYGPATLTLQYHPKRTGTFRPYVAAGAAYMIVFDADDGAFQNVRIKNDLSPALEGGTDIMFNDRYGIFLDVKKAFLRTTTTGTFGGAPVVGKVRLDPWTLSAGATFRF